MFGYWTGCLQQRFLRFCDPVVAVALGVAFAGERLSTNELVGGAIVLAALVTILVAPATAPNCSR